MALRMEQGRAEENARREAVRRRAAENGRAERAAAEVDTWLQHREAEVCKAAEGAPPPLAPARPAYEETPKWEPPAEPLPRVRRAASVQSRAESVRSAASHRTGSSSSSQRIALAQENNATLALQVQLAQLALQTLELKTRSADKQAERKEAAQDTARRLALTESPVDSETRKVEPPSRPGKAPDVARQVQRSLVPPEALRRQQAEARERAEEAEAEAAYYAARRAEAAAEEEEAAYCAAGQAEAAAAETAYRAAVLSHHRPGLEYARRAPPPTPRRKEAPGT
jgi:hypothetical protein